MFGRFLFSCRGKLLCLQRQLDDLQLKPFHLHCIAIPPACYRSLPLPSGPKCPRSVRENGGVSEGVSDGLSPARAPECPKSVPRVFPECPGHLFDTPGTLSGHFLDTPEPGARSAPETPRRTLPRTPPVFGDTLGTLRGQFGPEGPERLL